MTTPAQRYGKTVIGKVTTRPLPFTRTDADGVKTEGVIPSHTYEVIDIGTVGDGKTVYVTNTWYKEHKGICLMILAEIVESFVDYRVQEPGSEGGSA